MGCRRGIDSARTTSVTDNDKVRSILLVDDDPELLKALTKVLEKEHYEVAAHTDARDAIRFINETRKNFDLVITDVSMPGMKGTAFLAAIKTAFPRLPVIIITAFGDWGEYMNALREGAYEYLSKPLDKTDLLDAVRRALSNGARHASSV
jgi:DNA-binding NtrC family response regulator